VASSPTDAVIDGPVVLTAASGAVRLELTLTGYGWGAFGIGVDDVEDRVDHISYLCDILRGLVTGALDVALDRPSLIALALEPGGERYVLDYDDSGELSRLFRIRRFSFEDLWDPLGADEGQLEAAFEGVDGDDFAHAVLDLADQVLTRGMDWYCETWSRIDPFPSRTVAALRAALATARHLSPEAREEIAGE